MTRLRKIMLEELQARKITALVLDSVEDSVVRSGSRGVGDPGTSPTDYFHVVFTVPHELNALALDNPRLFYDLLFTASAQTLLEVAADPHHLGAQIGVISMLHTWGQNLLLHPIFTAPRPSDFSAELAAER